MVIEPILELWNFWLLDLASSVVVFDDALVFELATAGGVESKHGCLFFSGDEVFAIYVWQVGLDLGQLVECILALRKLGHPLALLHYLLQVCILHQNRYDVALLMTMRRKELAIDTLGVLLLVTDSDRP